MSSALSSSRSYTLKTILVQYIFALIALVILFQELNFNWLWASAFSWFFYYVIGEGIFLHRYFAHESFECKKYVAKIGAVLPILGAFGTPISWRIFHLTHHGNADKEKDPHSPVVKGFWYSFIGWQLEKHPPKMSLLLAKRLLTDTYYKFLEQHSIKIWWLSMIVLLLINWKLPFFIALGSCTGHVLAGFTNSLGHMVGSRRFDTKDNSRNIAWYSWITWQGSGALHNNHHAYPTRYHDSHAWYEFDVAKWIVPLLKRM
jgi:stearoyl-CoA desaturase (delta-9 desaturase)